MPLPVSDALTTRARRGVVVLLDRTTITVADLAVGPEGVGVHRWVVAQNGRQDLHWFDDDPASAVAALRRVLDGNGLPRRLACVALNESLFGTTLASLPRTTPAAMAALVSRRVREEAVAPEGDLYADHALVDVEGEADDTPRRGFVSWCSRTLMDGYVAEFRRQHLAVARVMPPSVALLDVFARSRHATEPRLELLVTYNFPSLVIGVFDSGRPLYLRVLRDVMADATDGVVGTVLREVLRTIAYAIENHQGRQVERVCHSGLTAADGERLAKKLHEHSALPAEVLAVPLSGPPDGADAQQLAVAAGLLLHGAPLAGRKTKALDLLPLPVGRVPRALATLGLLAVVAIVTGMTSLQLAKGTVQSVESEVRALEEDFEGLSANAAERTGILERATTLQPRRAVLELIEDRPGNPVQPLLEALLLVPPEAAVTSASLDNPYPVSRDRPRLDLRLGADFSGASGAERLNRLVSGLRTRPWCASLQVVQGGLRASRDDESMSESIGLGAWLR